MRIALVVILFALLSSNIIAQSDSLSIKQNIEKISAQISTIKASIEVIENENRIVTKENEMLLKNHRRLKAEFAGYKLHAENRVDSLQRTINSNSSAIEKTATELGGKIEKTEKSTTQKVTDLGKIISNSTLFWIVAVSVVFLLIVIVFILLRKQIFKEKNDLIGNIRNIQRNLEEESVKLDNKLVEVLDNQLQLLDLKNQPSESTVDTDHTLALKVADEIVRIQKNLMRMDKTTRGLNQLIGSVKRIQDNFAANGYELVEMLGQPYNEGMKVSANFIPDENLKTGEQVITRIIKPQVNFSGIMIQSAQIEVSQGE